MFAMVEDKTSYCLWMILMLLRLKKQQNNGMLKQVTLSCTGSSGTRPLYGEKKGRN